MALRTLVNYRLLRIVTHLPQITTDMPKMAISCVKFAPNKYRPAEDSLSFAPDNYRPAEDSHSDHYRPAEDSLPNHLRPADTVSQIITDMLKIVTPLPQITVHLLLTVSYMP